MAWRPNTKIYVYNDTLWAGTNLDTGVFLEGISITYGRQGIDESVRAGYATLDLLFAKKNILEMSMLQTTLPISITVENSAGVEVTVFTGHVAQWQRSWENYNPASPTEPVTRLTITATSNIGNLARQILFNTSFVQQFEDQRIIDILYLAKGQYLTWNDLDGTWNDLSGTWDDISQAVIGTGLFELQAEGASDVQVYDAIVNAAYSAGGLFNERKDGIFEYQNANYRFNKQSPSYTYDLIVDTTNSLGDFNVLANAWSTINQAIVVDGSGTSGIAEDATSIQTSGLRSKQWSTSLKHPLDADLLANAYLTARSTGHWEIPQVSFLLNNLSNAELDGMLDVNVSDLWYLANVPSTVAPWTSIINVNNFSMFVEGWQLVLNRETATMNVNLSPNDWTAYNLGV
jgi:hypothetical protein